MKNSGCIIVDPNVVNSWWYRKPIVKSVYMHLILSSEEDVMVSDGYHLSTGQLLSNNQLISKELSMSENDVLDELKELEAKGEILCEELNGKTLYSITAFESFDNNCVLISQ